MVSDSLHFTAGFGLALADDPGRVIALGTYMHTYITDIYTLLQNLAYLTHLLYCILGQLPNRGMYFLKPLEVPKYENRQLRQR